MTTLRHILTLLALAITCAAGGPGSRLMTAAGASEANWWEAGGATGCVAAYQPKGAASQAASYVNLANPGTYDAAPGNAPTWNTATGWAFNGSNQYLTTGVVPDGSYSVAIRFAACSTNNDGYLIGANVVTPSQIRYGFKPRASADNHAHEKGPYGFWKNVAGRLTAGTVVMAGTVAYLDGVSDVTGLTASTAITNPFDIGRYSGFAAQYGQGQVVALAIYDNSLSVDEVVAITNAMNDL